MASQTSGKHGALELMQVMDPFPAHCLSWFCLGYHMTDVIGRDACVADLLRRSQLVPAELCTEAKVRPVLAKILRLHPAWITLAQSNVAAVSVISVGSPLVHSFAPCVQEWAPVAVSSCCGKALVRWRLSPASFFTLASGMRRGTVMFFKCYKCGSVYGGCWKWLKVQDKSKFPDGFHAPALASTAGLAQRWFFATPQIVFEVVLLQYLLGLTSRGGVSFTGFAAVYSHIWFSTMQGTMYLQRTHFLQKIEMNVIVFAAVAMFRESGMDLRDFLWHLRPHHEANDFAELLEKVRQAFGILSAAHACWLFRMVPALIVDGKWCIQTSICNARDSNPVFNKDIREGFFKGCVERPSRGNLYCKKHGLGHGHGARAAESDTCRLTSHRKIVRADNVSLEYCVDGVWFPADAVETVDIRAYEKSQLRKTAATTEGECNKDTRKSVDETVSGRKSAGILAAVTPCLQIAAIGPMFASESISQLLIFICALRSLFSGLMYVIYDNACAVKRHLRKHQRDSPPGDSDNVTWKWLLALRWVIDRLHLTYHKACRDRSSSWFVEGVDPIEHPVLKGVDTEAAEQIFHVAERWQVVLSNAHPIHEELLLLVFAREHNKRHSCCAAAEKYRAAQRQFHPSDASRLSDPKPERAPSDEVGLCELPGAARRHKRRKAILACCESQKAVSVSAGSASSAAVSEQNPAAGDLRMSKSDLHSRYVWVNVKSKKIHHVVLHNSVTAGCGYFFGQSVKPRLLTRVDVDGYFTCGTCYNLVARVYSQQD